jgi:hypothetical protein
MGDPKPLASLNAGLLARKGAARPAMRRAPLGSGPANITGNGYDDLGWNDMGYDVDPEQSSEPTRIVDLKPLLNGSRLAHNLEAEQAVDEPESVDTTDHTDLSAKTVSGAMDDEAPLVYGVESVKPPVVQQQESLESRVAAATRKSVRVDEATPRQPRRVRAREKAAFTLRLDAERHLRLRLASAVTNRSAQIILTDLLDHYLSSLPEIEAMASRLPAAKKAKKNFQNGEMS